MDDVDLQAQPDALLLARVRRQPAGFAILFERHADDIAAFLVREARSKEIGLELTAECFAQALASAHRFRAPQDGSARPWLFGIARHLLASYRRRDVVESRARARLGMLAETTFAQHDDIVDELMLGDLGLHTDVTEALNRLPGEMRQALELRVADGLAYGEIATRLGCSPGAARTRVSRGLAALRADLERRSPA